MHTRVQRHALVYLLALGSLSAQNPSTEARLRLNAEDAVLNGAVSLATQANGYEGEGYLTGFTNKGLDEPEGDYATFTFPSKPGFYEISIRYATPSGEKGYGMLLNDERMDGFFTDAGAAFATHPAGTIHLGKGPNVLKIGGGWGYYHIDRIELAPKALEAPSKPPAGLVNPKATDSAKRLHSFLIETYGKKVLAGQQDLTEIHYIHDVTGKMPALGSFDFIGYSPSRLALDTHPSDRMDHTENWIQWQRTHNTLVSLMWHWNAPAGVVEVDAETGEPGWWTGFWTRNTHFDLAAALADPESKHYGLLISEMDAIAEELQKFKDADIPVLWRPLHEAPGGWFWWGAAGSEPFIELWKLMYDRFTGHHGLDHLVWVYTHEAGKSEWYPGDDYVDIVGMDIYTAPGASMSGQWEAVQRIYGGRKLIALTESGTPPEPDKVRTYQTWWSWFSIWNGRFVREIDPAALTRIYNDPDILTADELGDW